MEVTSASLSSSGLTADTQAYEAIDSNVAHQWRLWQGTLSGATRLERRRRSADVCAGKAGVTFEGESCGNSVGEKVWSDQVEKGKNDVCVGLQ
eukprot:756889-Hanusia_phi.AAC.1